MRRLESFLDDYSWLLLTGIWVLFIFWATQLYLPMVKVYKEDANKPPRNIELEQKLGHEMHELNVEQIRIAREKSETYSPQDYFNDYKAMEKLRYEIGGKHINEPPMHHIILMNLQSISMNNVGKNKKYTYRDVEAASSNFKEWQESTVFGRDEFRKETVKLNADDFLNYFLKFYLRGLPLALLMFIVSMSTRKGILETILADKFQFIYSLILWPFFLLKYPHNVIKEIIVEAELRRIGKIFRRFTPEENALVRQIAESKNFWNWIKQFQISNKFAFQHSFIISLTIVILFHVGAPLLAHADTDQTDTIRAGPKIISSTVINYAVPDNQHAPSQTDTILLPVFHPEFCASLILTTYFCLVIFYPKKFVARIEHIPLYGYLF